MSNTVVDRDSGRETDAYLKKKGQVSATQDIVLLTLSDLVLSLLVINKTGSFENGFITSNTNINDFGINNTKLNDLFENVQIYVLIKPIQKKKRVFFLTIGNTTSFLVLGLNVAIRDIENGLSRFLNFSGVGHFLKNKSKKKKSKAVEKIFFEVLGFRSFFEKTNTKFELR